LDDALRTLVSQTHEDLEIIISDNASTDETQRICESYAARDRRIHYFRQPVNRGGAFNHNFVAKMASGPYFRWYSYDDWMDRRCIEECARVLDENEDVVLAWPYPTPVYEADAFAYQPAQEYESDPPWDDASPSSRLRSLIGPHRENSLISRCYPIYGVARHKDFLATLPLGPFYGSDNVILVNLALRGRWYRLPEGLFFYRRHKDASTSGRSLHEVARWMDPAMSPGRSMPEWRRLAGFAKAVIHTRLSLRERLLCAAIVLKSPFIHRNWGFMWWDVKVWIKEVLATYQPLGMRATSGDT
jgi:glycosyltransferase involved in cell wall biosynthesis